MADTITGQSIDHNADYAHISVRQGSWIAGIALLLMTPLAVFANFFVLDDLITSGNAEQTASSILDAEGTFRFAIASLFLVAVLDLIVAWALYAVFKPVSSGIALLMAWFRAVFAGIFVVAISQLMGIQHGTALRPGATQNQFILRHLGRRSHFYRHTPSHTWISIVQVRNYPVV
jgi:hypothetical protein